jgi:hypothetical protein
MHLRKQRILVFQNPPSRGFFFESTQSIVGASLLAIPECQSTNLPNVSPLSPAGWLSQEINVWLNIRDASARATHPCLPKTD